MRKPGFKKLAVILNRLREREIGEENLVSETASLLRETGPEDAELVVRILRLDFGEASRLFGTHLANRIVSEALSIITPFKTVEVEEFLEKNKLNSLLERRSSILFQEDLDLEQAYLEIIEACRIKGKSSISVKAKRLANVLNKASEEEAALIISILTGRQTPVEDEAILKAVWKAFYSPGEQESVNAYGNIYSAVRRAVENAGRYRTS